jgi:hypothetical protein
MTATRNIKYNIWVIYMPEPLVPTCGWAKATLQRTRCSNIPHMLGFCDTTLSTHAIQASHRQTPVPSQLSGSIHSLDGVLEGVNCPTILPVSRIISILVLSRTPIHTFTDNIMRLRITSNRFRSTRALFRRYREHAEPNMAFPHLDVSGSCTGLQPDHRLWTVVNCLGSVCFNHRFPE